MSEVNLGRKKEKCENCTKQCNKKQSEESINSLQDKGLATGEVSDSASVQQVLLSACLSCDGCVSEEEGQRISQQNLDEINHVLALNKKCDTSKHKILVVSVCPQSLPYFAIKFQLDVPAAAQKLCGFLKTVGAHYVFDTTIAASFSILESQKEFIQRYRRKHHDSNAMPMFTSSCPGWIRYAERVLGSLVTPHICTARSPQQIMGEILHLMQQSKTSVEEVDSVALDHIFGESNDAGLTRHEGRGSEGFLEHIFKHAAKEIFGLEAQEIVYKTLRNRDFQEVVLERDGETLLQFAAVYGFRNIQTLVHRMRKGKVPYQLVEMEEQYISLPVQLPESKPELLRLYQDWLDGQDSPQTQQCLHTQYKNHTPSSAHSTNPDIQ
ncbi:hypothetical protein DNTS_010215, partial [Danionella cerebrum]